MPQFRMVGAALVCGVIGACLYLSVMLGSPGAMIFVYLTQLPLFTAGLWLGTGAAVVAGLTASLVLLAASDLLTAALFVALNAVPVILLVRQALLARQRGDGTVDWYPPGLLAAWLAALGLAGIAVAVLLLGGPQGVEGALRTVLTRIFAEVGDHNSAEPARVARNLAQVMPGVIAASWMTMVATNGILAQGLLARFGANWRPSPDIAALGLPRWLPIALALALAAAAIGGTTRFFGVNAMIALVVPFCLAGLAVLHAAVRRLNQPALALMVFYVLAMLLGWPFLIAAALGLAESWLGLRRRLGAIN